MATNNKEKSNTLEKNHDLYLLEQKIRALQNNRRTLLRQKYDCEKSLIEFSKELQKIKKTPLILGYIEEVFINEKKAIVKSSNGPSFLVNWSKDIKVKDLKPGVNVALNQRNYVIIEILKQNSDPYVAQMELEEKPNVTFEDIGGLDKQIQELKEAVDLPLTKPELFSELGVKPPGGVLLYGPPGTGKTLLARAIANYSNARFITVVGSALVQKYIGEGTRLVKELFKYAEKVAPSIIFIDELDAIGSKREVTTSGDLEVQRTLMELLAQIDGFNSHSNVKIIGATNRPDILDSALIRSGRFDKHLEITNPDKDGRVQIFKIYLKNMKIDISKNEIHKLADLADGYNGSMIKSICTEAGLAVIRRNEDQVTFNDLVSAIQNNEFDVTMSNQSQLPNFYT